MGREVGVEIALVIAFGSHLRHALGDAPQARDVGSRGDLGGTRGGRRLEQADHGVDLVDVLLGELGDEAAAPGHELHQALVVQHLERLAQRRAADAEVARQRLLVDALAGLELAVEDALPDALVDFFKQR